MNFWILHNFPDKISTGQVQDKWIILPKPHRQIVAYREDGVAERQEEEPEPGVEGFFGKPDAFVGF